MAVTDVINFYKKRTDEQNLKSIITQITNTKNKVQELTKVFIKAKNDLIRENIEKQVDKYEKSLNDLELQKAKLELERSFRTTKQDILDYIQVLLQGDVNDKEYQKSIIDNLVFQVTISDDNTLVVLNLNNDGNIDFVPLSDIEPILKETKLSNRLQENVNLHPKKKRLLKLI